MEGQQSAMNIYTVPLTGDITPALRGMGWDWAAEDAFVRYVAHEAVVLAEAEADALLAATDTLYSMIVEAWPDELPDDLLRLFHIPENLWALVRHSWADERHWHLYGRFDLAQTPDGPKLIEFNADTATSIPEAAVVQWAALKAAGYPDDAAQANGLYEALVGQLRHWRELNDDLDPTLLLIYLPDAPEDEANCAVLAEAAREAGFAPHLCPADDMQLSVVGEERGIWAMLPDGRRQRFGFLLKLVPWEILATDEPELTADLADLLRTRDVVVANPAYTLLFQSKAILAWLWQVYPHHPLLLEASLQPLGGHHVRKPLFGREGQNVAVLDGSRVLQEAPGDYAPQATVYQRWVELPTDTPGHSYQAGVFWAGEGCAISFRRESGIIHNASEFVPHVIK